MILADWVPKSRMSNFSRRELVNTLGETHGHLKDQDPICWGLQLSVGGIIVLNCLSLKFFPIV